MARRPYIDQHIIKDKFTAEATHSGNEYSTHCNGTEVVGMDGRCDWFRWNCRDCDKKFISQRGEKRMKYYRCTECGALHFVYKGFFSLHSRPNGQETEPLQQDEVDGVLVKCKLDYASSEFDQSAWHYGSPEGLKEKMQDDTWEVVESMVKV